MRGTSTTSKLSERSQTASTFAAVSADAVRAGLGQRQPRRQLGQRQRTAFGRDQREQRQAAFGRRRRRAGGGGRVGGNFDVVGVWHQGKSGSMEHCVP